MSRRNRHVKLFDLLPDGWRPRRVGITGACRAADLWQEWQTRRPVREAGVAAWETKAGGVRLELAEYGSASGRFECRHYLPAGYTETDFRIWAGRLSELRSAWIRRERVLVALMEQADRLRDAGLSPVAIDDAAARIGTPDYAEMTPTITRAWATWLADQEITS